MEKPAWFNKRARGGFALTATDAYEWHSECPCQQPKPSGWRQIRGRGDEGEWASAWLDWLWRTHIEPNGFTLIGRSSRRVLDIDVVGPIDLERLKRVICTAPKLQERPPEPPFDPTRL